MSNSAEDYFIEMCVLESFTEDAFESIQKYIDQGVPVDTSDHNGWTGLIWAARVGNARLMRLLVSNGANINLTDEDGMTPWNHAVLMGQVPSCDVLLENGVTTDPHSLFLAATYERASMLVWLLNHGFDPAIKNSLDETVVDVSERMERGISVSVIRSWEAAKAANAVISELQADEHVRKNSFSSS